MKKLQQHLNSSILFLLAVLTPIWFFPLSSEGFGTQKQLLFMLVAIILSATWIWRVVQEKRVLFSLSPISISSLVLLIAVGVSAMLAPNSGFQMTGRFLTILAMTLTLVFGFSNFTGFTWKKLLTGLTFGATILGGVVWWQFLLPNAFTFSALINKFFGTQFSTGVEFTVAESPAVLLALLVPIIVSNAIILGKKHLNTNKSLATSKGAIGSTLFLLATLIVVIFTLIQNPDTRPVLLPYHYGWGIAIENWKHIPRLLFGVGPEQFLLAFHRFRDVTYNVTDLWSLRFRASSSEALQAITTIGLVGFVAWIGVYLSGFWVGRKVFRAQPALFVFFLLQVVLFWIVPLSATTIVVLTLTLLAIMEEARQKDPNTAQDVVILLSAIQLGPSGQLKTKHTHAGFAYGTALVLGIGLFVLTFFAGKVYASNILYWQSLQAAQNNEVTKTYDLQQSAIRFAPNNTQYRRAYSSTNLAIARALAQNPDITEEQRQIFAQLLQQAIREARLAAQLNPSETENWEHLASIYSNMLDVEGSDRWATAALIQAIQTDPLSPQLRVQLGNLYVVLGQPDQSLRYFEQAIQLKPNWHVSYFRYGVALREMGQPGLASQAFERSLSLLDTENEDYAVVEDQFAQAKAEAEAASAQNAPSEPTEDSSVLNTQEPSVPNDEVSSSNGDPGFNDLLQSDPIQAQEQQPQPEPEAKTQEDNGIVLPSDVGF